MLKHTAAAAAIVAFTLSPALVQLPAPDFWAGPLFAREASAKDLGRNAKLADAASINEDLIDAALGGKADKVAEKVAAMRKALPMLRPLLDAATFDALARELTAMEQAMALFEHCMEQGWVLDGVVSQSVAQAQTLWRLREDISETISRWTPYKNDISTLISRVPDFLAEVEAVVNASYPDFEIVWFGHIGDGNVHLNMLKPDELPMDEFQRRCGEVSQWVFEIVQRYEGSISAEHGVGLLKKDYLHYSRSETEIAIMRQIKLAFDPAGIMNPGKVFDV